MSEIQRTITVSIERLLGKEEMSKLEILSINGGRCKRRKIKQTGVKNLPYCTNPPVNCPYLGGIIYVRQQIERGCRLPIKNERRYCL